MASWTHMAAVEAEHWLVRNKVLKAEPTGFLTEDHPPVLPGYCEVCRKVCGASPCLCHTATGLTHHSRRSINRAVRTSGRHLTRNNIPLKASSCSQARKGCPQGL